MSPAVEDSRSPQTFLAVRALRGESDEVALGVSFLPLSAIDPMRWGVEHEPEALLAAVCAQLRLDFVFVSGSEPWSGHAVDRLEGTGTAAFWSVDGPLGRVASSIGWGETLRLTASHPERLAPMLDRALANALSEIGEGVAATAAGIVIAEDLAGSSGPLISPDFANDELVPRLARMVRLTEDHGLPAIMHCDGDVRVFLSGVSRAGFSAIHAGGFGEEAFVRIVRDARTFGLRIIGGIEGSALREGVPAAVRAGTQAALFALAGDLLISDDGSISAPGELSAFMAALSAARGES